MRRRNAARTEPPSPFPSWCYYCYMLQHLHVTQTATRCYDHYFQFIKEEKTSIYLQDLPFLPFPISRCLHLVLWPRIQVTIWCHSIKTLLSSNAFALFFLSNIVHFYMLRVQPYNYTRIVTYNWFWNQFGEEETFVWSFVTVESSLLVSFVDLLFHVGSLAFSLKNFI